MLPVVKYKQNSSFYKPGRFNISTNKILLILKYGMRYIFYGLYLMANGLILGSFYTAVYDLGFIYY